VFGVGDLESAAEALLAKVGARELDGGGGEIDAGDLGAAFSETGEVGSRAATDFENRSTRKAVKPHEPEQVMQLLEMILVEIVEKPTGTDWMPRDVEIVDVPGPVCADLLCCRHGQTISQRFARMAVA
jgi:hypothetical protein